MDYTDLNDACPKDRFPLPRIDQIVDASAGHGMLSFLDAFLGYHQIPMHPPDAEKTSFIMPHGLYCYNVMPFGLKNAGATYHLRVVILGGCLASEKGRENERKWKENRKDGKS